MKKIMSGIIALVMSFGLFGFAGITNAHALELPPQPSTSDTPDVRVNGTIVQFPDTKPYIDSNNRTMIPVRAVSEQLDCNVEWDGNTQTATIEKGGISVSITIGENTLRVEGAFGEPDKTVTMDTTAVITGDRTCVPIRFVMESLGAWVGYSDMFKTVQIYQDVLTPEEINRLHAYYDMTAPEYAKANNEDYPRTIEQDIKTYPQIVDFAGTDNIYGFNNANEWSLRYLGRLEQNFKNLKGGHSTLKFNSATDPTEKYAALAIDEANISIQKMFKDNNSIKVKLVTDNSCVFSSRRMPSLAAFVRGVMVMDVSENASQADITKIGTDYNIKGLKAGQTIHIDVVASMFTDFNSGTVYMGQISTLK